MCGFFIFLTKLLPTPSPDMLHKIFLLVLLFVSSSVFTQEIVQKESSATNLINSSNNEEVVHDDIIIVAPSPTASLFHITSKILPNCIELYDMNGKFIEKSSSNKYINLGILNQGSYMLKLHYSSFTAVKKVIKK